MLSPAERDVLDALNRALRATFGARLRSVKMFGSRARGAGRDDSDLDVLVDVCDVTRDERGAILDVAADLGLASGLVLSVLVVREGMRLSEEILRDAVPL
jgi:predicted nucleotidyltransferase